MRKLLSKPTARSRFVLTSDPCRLQDVNHYTDRLHRSANLVRSTNRGAVMTTAILKTGNIIPF